MPVQHVNFYESLKEAQMRLNQTIVMYDNEPYFVICIDNHKSDGIFRVYMEPLGSPRGLTFSSSPYSANHPGIDMDHFLDTYKDKTPIIRKQLNSPLFNKFRPFPLGMCDSNGSTYYCERAPVRGTYQGLNRDMLNSKLISLDTSKGGPGRYGPEMYSEDFRKTILGQYMSAQDALSHLVSNKVKNQSLSFHREFCFIKGPVGTLFLAYKTEVVGNVVNRDFSQLNLVKKYFYTQEVINELGVFDKIVIADQ